MKKITLAVSVLMFIAMSHGVLGQTVSITPSSQTIDLSAGTTASVNIEISGLTTPLYGFQFDLTNNTNYWFLDTVTEGAFLGTIGVDLSCWGPQDDPSSIVSNYACTRFDVGAGITGGGVLAIVDIDSSLDVGTTTLSLSNVKLSDIDSQSISFSTVGATITSEWCEDGVDYRPCRVGGLPVDDTGECELGQEVCTAGEWIGDCNYPAPVFATAELCDTFDNNCDGSSDEDWLELGNACTVGQGECENTGVFQCTGDLSGSECSVSAGTPVAELCDGLDNNCDGSSDELWPELGTVCTEGLGECEDTGNYVCTGDLSGSECSATPGTPGVEACPYTPEDENCDGFDTEYKGDTYPSGTCSGCVDINDLSLIGIHFGETSASGNWEQGADLIADNEIDIFDLVMAGANFGNGC